MRKMKLSANILNDVGSVNSFVYTDTYRSTEGNACEVYFQLIDSTLNTATEGFSPPGRRYCPEEGATLQVTVGFIDDAKKIVRAATQPFSDPSIWKLTILSSDHWRGSADLSLRLTEDDVITYGVVRGALSIEPTSLGID